MQPRARRVAYAAAVVVLLAIGHVPRAAAQSVRSGTLRGVVVDSLTGLPLAGALVQVALATDAARARSTVADSLGRFVLDSLAAGKWLAGVFHPAVEALPNDSLVHVVTIGAGDTAIVSLGVPGPTHTRAMLCPTVASDSTAAIFGVVRDAESGVALDSARLALAWREIDLRGGARVVQRRMSVPLRADGSFVACGVPWDADVSAHADAPGRASGDVDVPTVARGATRLDMTVAADAIAAAGGHAHGAARLVGAVVDEYGRPVPNARVTVAGADGRATTNDAGAFALDRLPAGSWTVEARAIGYETGRTPATLTATRVADVRLIVETHVAALDRIVVTSRGSPTAVLLAEFHERRAQGTGTFLDPQAIERRQAAHASELLRGIPGFSVLPARRGNVVRGRGGCTPGVYVDGFPIDRGADELDLSVAAANVLAIEVYHGPETPPRFAAHGPEACGAIVFWTKR